MTKKPFKAHHMNAEAADLAGNQGIGRYVLLPGASGRAKEIASHFDHLEVKSHPRGHHLYLGTIQALHETIEVAAISSGMGCPSMEIILHELFQLGAKRFLRVGTAGSLHASAIKIGDIINAHASVRDENTTNDYVPSTVPAVASFEFMAAISNAAKNMQFNQAFHTGTVHCKSSFYAREFGAGPNASANKAYIDLLSNCGVLATEMETSALFIQSQLYDHELRQQGKGPAFRVLSGAILGILAVPPDHFAEAKEEEEMVKSLTHLAFESVKNLWRNEKDH